MMSRGGCGHGVSVMGLCKSRLSVLMELQKDAGVPEEGDMGRDLRDPELSVIPSWSLQHIWIGWCLLFQIEVLGPS